MLSFQICPSYKNNRKILINSNYKWTNQISPQFNLFSYVNSLWQAPLNLSSTWSYYELPWSYMHLVWISPLVCALHHTTHALTRHVHVDPESARRNAAARDERDGTYCGWYQ